MEFSSSFDRITNKAGKKISILAFGCSKNLDHDKNWFIHPCLIQYWEPSSKIPSVRVSNFNFPVADKKMEFFSRHQLMDVLGSSGSLVAHSAAVETFVNPTSTNRPDLCERYLWALAQTKVPETQIVQGKQKVQCVPGIVAFIILTHKEFE